MRTKLIFIFLLLPVILLGQTEWEGNVSWDANTEPDLDGYFVHLGEVSGEYKIVIDVGNKTTHMWLHLEFDKTYYFAVTAYDENDNISSFSEEVSRFVEQPEPTDTTPPGAPKSVTVEIAIKVKVN